MKSLLCTALLGAATMTIAFGQAGFLADSPDITSGLVAFLPLDGTATNLLGGASIASEIGATITPTTNRFGIPNSAVHLPGGAYITLSPSPFADNAAWTVSVWAELAVTNGVATVFSTGPDYNAINFRYTYSLANPWLFWFSQKNSAIIAAQAPLSLTTWHQLTVSHNPTNSAFFYYVDGAPAGTGTSSGTSIDAGSLWFGRHEYPGGAVPYDLVGDLDEIRVYNRCLSSNEVAALFSFDSSINRFHPASATSHLVNGFVVGVDIVDPGYGYQMPPNISFSGGGGSGASALASVSNGVVTAIKVLTAGAGYTNPPSVIIDAPEYPPTQAAAYAVLTNGFVVSAPIIDGGHKYSTPPPVYFLGGGGSGATGTAIIQDGIVTGINITNPGSGYTSPPTVLIAAPSGTPGVKISVETVNLALTLVPGYNFQIQGSTDLINWQNIGGPFLATSTTTNTLVDVNQVGQYFRLVEAP
jgi:Concanavalin A-like lectin/glucanases superfamily